MKIYIFQSHFRYKNEAIEIDLIYNEILRNISSLLVQNFISFKQIVWAPEPVKVKVAIS